MPATPRAARSGGAALFMWRAPELVNTGVPPTVTFVSPGGGTLLASALTHMWSPTVAQVSAVADDRQTLTLNGSVPAISRSAAANNGDAWVVTVGAGYVPVKVVRLSSAAAVLAEPLPRDIGSTGELHSQWWSCAIGAGDVTATAQRGVTWRVAYYAVGAGPLVSAYLSQDVGIIDVVRTPFDTGLSTEDLVALMDPGGSRVPARALGYEAAIQASLDELVAYLRGDSPTGLDEHDLNGPELRPVHRHLACAYLARNPDESVRYRSLAFALWDRIRLRCWRDADRDGLATDSEREHPLTWVGGTFSTGTAARRTWDDVD